MRSLLALLLVAHAVATAAADSPLCSGATCTATLVYTEPTTKVDGAPLTDLQDGVFTYVRDGKEERRLVIPSSKPAGGGTISVDIALQVPPCTDAVFTGALVMRSPSVRASAPVTAPTLSIQRSTLPTGEPDPACVAPTSVTLQCRDADCALTWTPVVGAQGYRVVRCTQKDRCARISGWQTVATTTGTTASITAPPGLSDYAVYADTGTTSKLLGLRTTVMR